MEAIDQFSIFMKDRKKRLIHLNLPIRNLVIKKVLSSVTHNLVILLRMFFSSIDKQSRQAIVLLSIGTLLEYFAMSFSSLKGMPIQML